MARATAVMKALRKLLESGKAKPIGFAKSLPRPPEMRGGTRYPGGSSAQRREQAEMEGAYVRGDPSVNDPAVARSLRSQGVGNDSAAFGRAQEYAGMAADRRRLGNADPISAVAPEPMGADIARRLREHWPDELGGLSDRDVLQWAENTGAFKAGAMREWYK